MTKRTYEITAWRDDPHTVSGEFEADSPQAALVMAKQSFQSEFGESCYSATAWDTFSVALDGEEVLSESPTQLQPGAKSSSALSVLADLVELIESLSGESSCIDEDIMQGETYLAAKRELAESAGESVHVRISMESGLPPDPDGKNDDRAACASAALVAFLDETHTDPQDALPDLLGNLMHWCDRSGRDFDAALERARKHYAAETGGEVA